MSPRDIPRAYLKKAESRLKALRMFQADGNYSDCVRESQELVELCSKALLRIANQDPPHVHDVGRELLALKDQLKMIASTDLDLLAQANHWLRREREMSFYGADDFDPTEGYSPADAAEAIAAAELALKLLRSALA